jgi:hypothetical protein
MGAGAACAVMRLHPALLPRKALTIIREPSSPVPDPQDLALAALGWVLAEGSGPTASWR